MTSSRRRQRNTHHLTLPPTHTPNSHTIYSSLAALLFLPTPQLIPPKNDSLLRRCRRGRPGHRLAGRRPARRWPGPPFPAAARGPGHPRPARQRARRPGPRGGVLQGKPGLPASVRAGPHQVRDHALHAHHQGGAQGKEGERVCGGSESDKRSGERDGHVPGGGGRIKRWRAGERSVLLSPRTLSLTHPLFFLLSSFSSPRPSGPRSRPSGRPRTRTATRAWRRPAAAWRVPRAATARRARPSSR